MTQSTTHSQTGAASLPRDKDRPSAFFEAAKVSSVGMEMAVATLIGWGIGYWLDGKYNTGPYLMIIGLLFGVGAGFNGLIRTANEVNARHRKDAETLAAYNAVNSSAGQQNETPVLERAV